MNIQSSAESICFFFKRILLFLSALSLLSGCAYRYINENGEETVVGLLKLTIHKEIENHEVGAESTNVSNVGISILKTPVAKGLSIGYNDETVTIIRNNAVVGGLAKYNIDNERSRE